MTPKNRNEPRVDKERDTREAVIKDADETNERDRDAVHGDGDTVGLPDPASRERSSS